MTDKKAKERGALIKEALRYYSANFEYLSSDEPTLSIVTNIADHFANWQRDQMLKEAVEATVMATKCGDKYQQLLISDWNSMSDMCNGDKVKIIIVKED